LCSRSFVAPTDLFGAVAAARQNVSVLEGVMPTREPT
jgi:hypothetical protein